MDRYRALFPAVQRCTYLNTAGGGPMARSVAEAAQRYYAQAVAAGDLPYGEWMAAVEETRDQAARFLHVAADDVAFLANGSHGLSLAAHLFDPADEVVCLEDEFPSVSLPWLARGHTVRFVPTEADGTLSLDALDRHVGPATRVVATSAVQYASGFRWDLAALSNYCRDHGLALVLDATQAAGAVPFDLRETPVDVFVASGYKWLTAGYGIALLYVHSDRMGRLPAVGWRSNRPPHELVADRLPADLRARSLEGGHPPLPGVLALGAALHLIESIGIDRIAARVEALTTRLHDLLDDAGLRIVSPRRPGQRVGITVVNLPDPKAASQRLAEQGIHVSARRRGLRVSAHYYNNEADLDRLVSALR